MTKNLQHLETLIYYDVPELFVGMDELDVHYLCLHAESDTDSDQYLCAPISGKRLKHFLSGNLDLRTIYQAPETNELFYTQLNGINDGNYPLNPLKLEDLAEKWLPEPGFFYKMNKDESPIIAEARERNRAIILLP